MDDDDGVTDEDSSEAAEWLPGGEVLESLTNELLQRLLEDERLAPWTGANHARPGPPPVDIYVFRRECQSLLAGAFGGIGSWPTLPSHAPLSAILDHAPMDSLVGSLLQALERPLPLGQDALGAAVRQMQMQGDRSPGLSSFLRFIHDAVVALAEAQRREQEQEQEVEAVEEGVTETEEEEGEPEEEDDDEDSARGPRETLAINATTFEELVLEEAVVELIQESWHTYIAGAGSPEAGGEQILVAIFEASPTVAKMFTSPRALHAMRFANTMSDMVAILDQPAPLKAQVESLAFGHMNLEVTLPMVTVFRDSILLHLSAEVGISFTDDVAEGWDRLLTYIGGAILYTKARYSERVNTLLESWRIANESNPHGGTKSSAIAEFATAAESEFAADDDHDGKQGPGFAQRLRRLKSRKKTQSGQKSQPQSGELRATGDGSGEIDAIDGMKGVMNTNVPTTYREMFEFNAVVMGYGKSSPWLRHVLDSFENMVLHAADPTRLQEECDVLALKIGKTTTERIDLNEYRACMLAALRSRLPKVWDSNHEVAWNWLWDNVARLLRQNLGNPPKWEKASEALMDGLDSAQLREMRTEIYERFFEVAPEGQEYFKQSNTRLHFILERIMEFPNRLYKDPMVEVEEISAVALRHVGYGISTQLVGPFVSSIVEMVSRAAPSKVAQEAYRWAMGLISKILVRIIKEGSTIVMKAINANSGRMLRTAVSCAPRGERAQWLLNVQVGTQRISPLVWAIETGSLEAANAILKDLLTIRADREKYYYGLDELFCRHPDIVCRLATDAPSLLPTLLEGLVWRSRHTKNGLRRVNYYIKHLVVNENGGLSNAFEAVANAKETNVISHPVIVLVSDTLWSGVVRRQFVFSKLGFLFTLLVFMLTQAILPKTSAEEHMQVRWAIFVGRMLNYVATILRLARTHIGGIVKAYQKHQTVAAWRIPIPRYLRDPKDTASLALLLLLVAMCTHEPMLHCIGDKNWPTEFCEKLSSLDSVDDLEWRYMLFSLVSMIILWTLLIDLAVFSTRLAAFVLVCRDVISEVGRFLVAMLFLLITFSSAVSCLRQTKSPEFSTVPAASQTFFAITVGLYEGDYRELLHDPFLLTGVLFFVTGSTILLINLLIAQLNCSYEYVYQDVVGSARLDRATLIVDTLSSCPQARWKRYVDSLHLDTPLEFDEGDVGLKGGIQLKEPGSLHQIMDDRIRRYGGTCAAEEPWPADEAHEDESRMERVERLVRLALKRARTSHARARSQDSRSGSMLHTSKGSRTGSKGSKGSFQEEARRRSKESSASKKSAAESDSQAGPSVGGSLHESHQSQSDDTHGD